MKKLLTLILLTSLFISCSSSDDDDKNRIELKTSDVALFYLDEAQIEATSNTEITYASADKYHASVSSTGLIKAGRVGETEVVLSNGEDTKKIKVAIKPKSNLYPEPNTEFGISRGDLIKKLGTPDNESTSGIGYSNYSTNAPIVTYLFDDNNKLVSSSVLVKASKNSELVDFTVERYLPYLTQNNVFFFINDLKEQNPTMVVSVQVYSSSYIWVMYMSFDKNATSRNTFDNEAVIKRNIETLLK